MKMVRNYRTGYCEYFQAFTEDFGINLPWEESASGLHGEQGNEELPSLSWHVNILVFDELMRFKSKRPISQRLFL